MKCFLFCLFLLFATVPLVGNGEVVLPSIFSSNMVLQRELSVPVWGTADAGEKVTVRFCGQSKVTEATEDGKWMVHLDPLETSSNGQTLIVVGKNRVELSDVLVGEVWLCSGQSNMADSFNSSKSRFIEPESFAKGLDHMRVSTRLGWTAIDEKTQRTVSRVAFYFGQKLYRDLNIPIGLILRYNSGTPIQSWIPQDESEIIRKKLGIPEGWNDIQENRNPGVQFADKIDPIVPFCFRGVIWYQGERNAKAQTGFEYRKLLPFLIENWRHLFAERSQLPSRAFSFYYVQVPTQDHTGEWPWLRDSMRRALQEVENAGMAVFYDHGPSLHPDNKRVAGERLALWALAKDYERKDLSFSGPLLKSVEFQDSTAVLLFDHVAEGLSNPLGDPNDLPFFEIAGDDGEYVNANAKIVGDHVHVSHASISRPRFVRYLFRKPEPNPQISLINSAGLPASSFITDEFEPPRIPIADRPTAKGRSESRRQKSSTARSIKGSTARQDGPEKTTTEQRLQVLTEANGLAPEIVDLSNEDISFSKEKNLVDLKTPFIDVGPEDMADGIEVGELGLDSGNKSLVLSLAREIDAGLHGEIDSLLIHHDGRLIFESYYRRGRVNYPHYQMSITKSYTALALGRAIGLGYLKISDLDRPILDFLEEIDRTKITQGCDTITLRDALNMHSGIRVSQDRVAELRRGRSDLAGQGQIQAYFANTLPVTKSSKQYKYQSSDPSMVMQVIESVVPGSAEAFIREELLKPLGITNYGWQEDVSRLPKSAAGSSIRSRDMIKLGLLVQSRGVWDGEQLIPSEFIDLATSKIYKNPENTCYGFFWWQHQVEVAGEVYGIKTARGAGGQYIMLIDSADLVIAITAHNQGMGNMLNTAPSRLIPALVSGEVNDRAE
jgi:CubicO group peptidase (beta-lactamase class C family)